MIDADAKVFTASTINRVAGCEPVTLRAWRSRNGLIPETGPRASSKTWNRFSLIDACITRTVVVLTSSGILASEAIWFAEQYLRTPFELAHKGRLINDLSGIVAFASKAAASEASFRLFVEPKDLMDVLAQFDGLVTLLDLNYIYAHVKFGIEALGSNAVEQSTPVVAEAS